LGKGLDIYGEKMEVDGDSRRTSISGSVRILKDGSIVTGERLEADLQKDTYTVIGGVLLAQKDRAAAGDVATIENASGDMTLSGKVKFVIEKASSLLDETAARALRNPQARGALREKTVLLCDTLKLSSEKNNAHALGRVEIDQKEKRARADEALYDPAAGTVTLTGNVFIEKKNEWIRTSLVIASISGESFEAIGQVEAQIKIKR